MSVGVRGEITAECMELMGIENYRIIGCPSFYSFGWNPPIFRNITSEKICFTWGSSNYKKEQWFRELMRNTEQKGDALIMQSIEDFPLTLFEEAHLLPKHIKSRYPDIDVNRDDLEKYIKRLGHMFFDRNEWMKFLKEENFTFSVGCRFHGNMIAWLSGIPTLWITHDSRTFELCKVLKVPTIDIDKVSTLNSREELINFCEYKKDFYDNYQLLYQNYLDFLHENDLMEKV